MKALEAESRLSTSQLLLADPPVGRRLDRVSDELLPGINILKPWTSDHHQVYYRVYGGESGLWQRCLIFAENAAPRTGQRLVELLAAPPADILGGEIWPTRTPWYRFDSRDATWTYYFCGQYHQNGAWRWDHGVRKVRDIHENGVVYSYNFDAGDRDYDDFEIEMAFVWMHEYDHAIVEGAPTAEENEKKRYAF